MNADNPEPIAEPESIGPRWEALAVGVGVLLAYLLLRTSPYLAAGAFSDDGIYLALGRALADGEGYRSVYAVGDPVHLKYPPGLPLLHALFWTLGDTLDGARRLALLASAAASAAACGVLWWVGRARYGVPAPALGVLVVGVFLLESSVQYFNLAASEPWFVLGWAAALAIVVGSSTDVEERRDGWLGPAALGLVLAASALVRSQALVLIPAFALTLLVRYRRLGPASITTAAAAVPLLIWNQVHASLIAAGPVGSQPDEAPYGAWLTGGVSERLGGAVRAARANLEGYADMLPHQLAAPDGLGLVILAGLGGSAAWGAVRAVRAGRSELWLPVALQVGVVLAWPFAQDRFVAALLPFVALLAAYGIAPAFAAERLRLPVVLTLAAVALASGLRQAQIRSDAWAPDGGSIRYHPARYLVANSVFLLGAGQWLNEYASPHDRVLAPYASGLHLYTGRKTVNSNPAQPQVGPSVFDDPGRFLANRILVDNVTLVVLSGPHFPVTRDVAAVQATCPEVLEFWDARQEPAQFAVYRVVADPACLSGLARRADIAAGAR